MIDTFPRTSPEGLACGKAFTVHWMPFEAPLAEPVEWPCPLRYYAMHAQKFGQVGGQGKSQVVFVRLCPRLPWWIFLVMVVFICFYVVFSVVGCISSACRFCLQAAPAAEDAKAAEAETNETGEAKADAVEEVKETAEASYVM